MSFCECGQLKEKFENMCPECKSWSKNIPRQKKVGKDKKKYLNIGGNCLNCGGKCAQRATMCRECYHKSLGRIKFVTNLAK